MCARCSGVRTSVPKPPCHHKDSPFHALRGRELASAALRSTRNGAAHRPASRAAPSARPIPSYRIPELESIAAAYPKCALLYTCVEQRRGFFVQIKVVDGVATDTRPEGCTASEVVQKAIAIPSIRRMWEMSG